VTTVERPVIEHVRAEVKPYIFGPCQWQTGAAGVFYVIVAPYARSYLLTYLLTQKALWLGPAYYQTRSFLWTWHRWNYYYNVKAFV